MAKTNRRGGKAEKTPARKKRQKVRRTSRAKNKRGVDIVKGSKHLKLTELMVDLILDPEALRQFSQDPETMLRDRGFTEIAIDKITNRKAQTLVGAYVLADQNPGGGRFFDTVPVEGRS